MMNRVEPFLPAKTSAPIESSNGSRPETLEQFVGQGHLKALIKTAAQSARQRNAAFPHSLVTGSAGLGKTSIARLVAIQMNVAFIPTTAESLEDSASVKGLLSRLDDSG